MGLAQKRVLRGCDYDTGPPTTNLPLKLPPKRADRKHLSPCQAIFGGDGEEYRGSSGLGWSRHRSMVIEWDVRSDASESDASVV